jgi:hypothetical protein
VERLRRQLSYANVMATVAVFVALGGGAYAAVKITGRDVANRSLTGKDIKKRSVPLNRLRGSPARGRQGKAGPQGPEGDQGPPGPVDPSQFLSATGTTTVAVGPTEWVASVGGLPLERTGLDANRVEWSSSAAVGAQFLHLEPSLPIALAGRPTRVVAATLCYSTTEAQVRLTGVLIDQFRGPLGPVGTSAQAPGEFDDVTIRDESACRRYQLPPTFVLASNDYINIRLRFDFDAADQVYVGAASFELAPA